MSLSTASHSLASGSGAPSCELAPVGIRYSGDDDEVSSRERPAPSARPHSADSVAPLRQRETFGSAITKDVEHHNYPTIAEINAAMDSALKEPGLATASNLPLVGPLFAKIPSLESAPVVGRLASRIPGLTQAQMATTGGTNLPAINRILTSRTPAQFAMNGVNVAFGIMTGYTAQDPAKLTAKKVADEAALRATSGFAENQKVQLAQHLLEQNHPGLTTRIKDYAKERSLKAVQVKYPEGGAPADYNAALRRQVRLTPEMWIAQELEEMERGSSDPTIERRERYSVEALFSHAEDPKVLLSPKERELLSTCESFAAKKGKDAAKLRSAAATVDAHAHRLVRPYAAHYFEIAAKAVPQVALELPLRP